MKNFLECKGKRLIVLGITMAMLGTLLASCGSSYSPSESAYSSDGSVAAAGTSPGGLDRSARNQQNQQAQGLQVPGTQAAKGYNDVYYEDYGVNPFQEVQDEPTSTFSMDVDTASYTKARNYINNGTLPPKDAVRVEEFINYFKRQYPAPARGTFSIYTEMAPSAFNRGYHMLEIGLQGKTAGTAELKNTSLTFVIDVSGSMNTDKRLKLVKKSLGILVNQMGGNDKIGIAVYGTNGRKLLDPTTGNDKKRIMNAINGLRPEGSTNAAEGLMIGYDMASKAFIEGGNNRVILCTDGVANEGITKAEDILKTVEDYKAQGITLTALGFGMDNYNDIFLETLADKGDGNYAYIDTIEEAQKVLADQLAGTLQVIAKDAKVQVEFDTATVESYRLIGYENRALANEDFQNNSVDAGEVGAGHAVTALYEVKLKSRTGENVGVVRIRYKDPQTGEIGEESKQIGTSDIWGNFYDATPRFRFITMVAQTAEILRGSPWAGNTSLSDVYDLLVKDMNNLDRTSEDNEFIDLVKKAVNIKMSN